MSYESQSRTEAKSDEVSNSGGFDKACKTGYVVVIYDDEGHIQDTPFASFDKGLAEEIALEYAWELMWNNWYWLCHGPCEFTSGWTSLVYENKLTDYFVYVKEIPWHG